MRSRSHDSTGSNATTGSPRRAVCLASLVALSLHAVACGELPLEPIEVESRELEELEGFDELRDPARLTIGPVLDRAASEADAEARQPLIRRSSSTATSGPYCVERFPTGTCDGRNPTCSASCVDAAAVGGGNLDCVRVRPTNGNTFAYYQLTRPIDCDSGEPIGPTPGVTMLVGRGKKMPLYDELVDRLASNGIAVALTSPTIGTGNDAAAIVTRSDAGIGGIQALLSDAETATNIDDTRLGVFGHSQGGEATSRVALGHPNVSAIAFAGPTDFLANSLPSQVTHAFGIQTTRDADVIGGSHSIPGNGTPEPIPGALSMMDELMDEGDDDPRTYITKLLYGGTHDHSANSDIAVALTTSFFRRVFFGDVSQDPYLQTDALPPGTYSQSWEVYTQFRGPARRVVDDFESDGLFINSMGSAVGGEDVFGLVAFANQLANNAHAHTSVLHFTSAAPNGYVWWQVPPSSGDVSPFEYLSFRIGQNYYVDREAETGPAHFWIWLGDDAALRGVDTTAHAVIPAADKAQGAPHTCTSPPCPNFTITHMRTVRIPLSEFASQGIDLAKTRYVIVQVPPDTHANGQLPSETAAGNQYFLDSIEFTD